MTVEEIKQIEDQLKSNGYELYRSCLTSTEDYGYFKSFDITTDKHGNEHVGYQVEFRFWDWTKYGQTGNEAMSIDIIFLTSSYKRVDMILTNNNYDIKQIESIAGDFYKFCHEHKLI